MEWSGQTEVKERGVTWNPPQSSTVINCCGGKLEGFGIEWAFLRGGLDLFQLGVSKGSSATEGYVRSSWGRTGGARRKR